MLIDCFVLSLVLTLTLIGWSRGFLQQVLGWVAFGLAAVFAPRAAGLIKPTLLSAGYTANSVEVAALLLGFSATFFVLWIVQLSIPDKLRNWSLPMKRIDGVLGAALAAIKALCVCWLILSSFLLLESDLLNRWPELNRPWSSSVAVARCRQYNPIAELGLTELAELRKWLARSDTDAEVDTVEPAQGKSNDAPKHRGIDADAIESPVAKADAPLKAQSAAHAKTKQTLDKLRQDKGLRRLARKRDWSGLLKDRRIQRLLARGGDWAALLNQASKAKTER